MKIGMRIKQLRLKKGITLNKLAQSVGLTTSFLSQLERDLTSPSVGSLEKIAQALNLKIAEIFQEDIKKDLIIIRKHSERQAVTKKGDVFAEPLASGVFDINMHSQLFSLGVGALLTERLININGEKFIMVLKGMIEFFIGKEKFVFEEGDTIYCASTQSPYKIVNIGTKEARVLYISFLPV